MESLQRLGLGTVQFGLSYGISNTVGVTPLHEISGILAYAQECGVEVLDTAVAYGDSEAVLGSSLSESHSFRIVTKLPSCGEVDLSSTVDGMEQSVKASLGRLNQRELYGVLFHDASCLLSDKGEALWGSLVRVKEKGLFRKIGVSVYSPVEAERIMERYAPDILQIPVNVLDQRFLAQGHVHELKRTGVEIHARSCFLQGLLLMDPDTLHPFFEPVRGLLREFRQACRDNALSPVEAALGFALSQGELDVVLVGVNSLGQLREIVESAGELRPVEQGCYERFSIGLQEIVEPWRWPDMSN